MSEVDPVLVKTAERLVKPASIVWDVGANIGLFSIAAASLAGQGGSVVAFEPDPWLAHTLQRSVDLQSAGSAEVAVICAAVAAANSIRPFAFAKRSRASSHLLEYGHSQTGGIEETRPVLSVTLDWVSTILPPPSLVKIDVEGAELEVLRGTQGLLRSVRPVLICEVSSEASEAVTGLLHNHGYELVDGETGRSVDRAPWATIATPRPA